MIFAIGVLVFLLFCAVYEGWALVTQQPTISDLFRWTQRQFGLFEFLLGAICGGFAVHIFWQWCT